MDKPRLSRPRLWLGVRERSTTYAQCDCDCDCACPNPGDSGRDRIPFERFARQIRSGAIREIRVSPGTYSGQIGEGTVALGAQGEHAIVMDSEASLLLDSLPAPATLQDLRMRLVAWPDAVFEEIVSILLALDVLSSLPAKSRPLDHGRPKLAVWLHLTNECDLSCPYCYVTRDHQHMDVTTARHAVAAVYRSAQIHRFSHVKLKYAGGEPSLNFDTLLAAQRHAESLSAKTGIGLESGLLTNGVCLTEAQIDALLAHNIRVMVSLDGVGPVQDTHRPMVADRGRSFEKVSRTLDRLVERGLAPHISVTITKWNLNGLPSLVDYLLSRDLHFSFNFYREPDLGSKQNRLRPENTELIDHLLQAFVRIEQQLPRYSLLSSLADRADLGIPHLRTCGVGKSYLVVDCRGNVARCQMDLAHPVTTIEARDPLAPVRAEIGQRQNPTVEQKDCRGCVWQFRCTGGCPRLTHQQTGRYTARSPLCDVYQASLPEILRLEALRLMMHEDPWDFSLH